MAETEGRMRVYRVPEHLREELDRTRNKRRETIRGFLAEAVAQELPDLAKTLLELGVEKYGKTRPARWPLEPATLKQLAYVSAQTGVPQNQLLLACVATACKRKRRRPSKRRKAEPTDSSQ